MTAPRANELLLGKMALQRGLITQEQLAECVAVQEEDSLANPSKPPRSIGAILLARGYLTDESLAALLSAQAATLQSPHPDWPTLRREDLLFGRTVAREGLAPETQVNAALRAQEQLHQQGVTLRLGEVLVKKGFLSPQQVKQILALQCKALLSCPRCGKNFNVRNRQPGKEVFCPKCSGLLVPLKTEQSIDASDSRVLPAVRPAPEQESFGGRPLGRYRLLEKLGEGGMGIVWKAWDTELKRIIALKEIKTGAGGASPHDVARFVQEARAVAKLRHPGIVQVHDVGDVAGRHFFTMDCVEGMSLEKIVDGPTGQAVRPLRMAARRALEIVKAAAEALHYAHSHGVVHRDVKPANILVETDESGNLGCGRVLVMDFGLAKDVKAEAGPRLTVTGAVMGTPAYMSPEQAMGRQHLIGPKSDVFSLGSVLYELLTGRPPFVADGLVALLGKVIGEEPVAPSRVARKVHRDVETICLKALEKDPKKRYETAATFAEDIGRYLNGEPISARPISRTERLWRRVVKRKAVVIPSAVAAVIGVAFVASAAYGSMKKSRDVADALARGAQAEARSQALKGDEADRECAAAAKEYQSASALDPDNASAGTGLDRVKKRQAALAEDRRQSLAAERARAQRAEEAKREADVALTAENIAERVKGLDKYLYSTSLPMEEYWSAIEECLEGFDALVAQHPEVAQVWYRRGRTRLMLSLYRGAEEDLTRALELQPGHYLARLYRARLYAEWYQALFYSGAASREEERRRKQEEVRAKAERDVQALGGLGTSAVWGEDEERTRGVVAPE